MNVYKNCYFFHMNDDKLGIETQGGAKKIVSNWSPQINGKGEVEHIKTNKAYYYPAEDCHKIQK